MPKPPRAPVDLMPLGSGAPVDNHVLRARHVLSVRSTSPHTARLLEIVAVYLHHRSLCAPATCRAPCRRSAGRTDVDAGQLRIAPGHPLDQFLLCDARLPRVYGWSRPSPLYGKRPRVHAVVRASELGDDKRYLFELARYRRSSSDISAALSRRCRRQLDCSQSEPSSR